MMNTNRTIEEVFSNARKTTPKPLYSVEQVQAMIAENGGAGQQAFSKSLTKSLIKRRIVMGVVSLTAIAGIIAGISWWGGADTPQTTAPATQMLPTPNSTQNKNEASAPAQLEIPPKHFSVAQQNSSSKNRHANQPPAKSSAPEMAGAAQNSISETQPLQSGGNSGSVSANDDNRQPVNQDSIQGVQKIQLTPEELQKIGILFDGHRLTIQTEDKQDNRFAVKSVSIDSNDYYEKGTTINNAQSLPVAPIIVASHWNQGVKASKAFLRFVDNSPFFESLSMSRKELEREAMKFNNLDGPNLEKPVPTTTNGYPKLSRLIPIYVRLGSGTIEGTNKKYGADVYLWYYPTPEFVLALPSRYRIPLQQELDAITDVVECQMPVGQACERLTGEKTFFDFCRKSSGAIAAVQAYPNPASGSINCRYQLTNQRAITITLHDLSGKFLRELVPAQSVTAGVHQEQLSLVGLTPGAYLIAVKTDTGDQAVQRIIVQ